MLDDFLGDGTVLVDVELEPLDGWRFLGKDVVGGGVDDFVEGAGCEGGYLVLSVRWLWDDFRDTYHLNDVVLACAAGEDYFALGVAEFT